MKNKKNREQVLKLVEFGALFSIIFNIYWLLISFGSLQASIGIFAIALSLSIILNSYIVSNFTISLVKELKENKPLITKISNFLSILVVLLLLFGQMVFGWYYILYFVILIGSSIISNPELFKNIN